MRAAMASTTTTARGDDDRVVSALDRDLQIVSFPVHGVLLREMEGVGLTAARRMTALPSLMPPRVPPAWFVRLCTPLSSA